MVLKPPSEKFIIQILNVAERAMIKMTMAAKIPIFFLMEIVNHILRSIDLYYNLRFLSVCILGPSCVLRLSAFERLSRLLGSFPALCLHYLFRFLFCSRKFFRFFPGCRQLLRLLFHHGCPSGPVRQKNRQKRFYRRRSLCRKPG